MTNVWTQAGLSNNDRRLFRPPRALLILDRCGEGERPGEEEGLRGGEGRRDPDLDLRVLRSLRPISSEYGEIEDRLRPCFLAKCSFSSSSCSTSCISALTFSSGFIASPSLSMRTPKTRKSPAARKLVKRFGMSVGTACPRTAERIVIVNSAESAAEKTSNLACFMAISAAMRNVLSPISENRIIVSDRTKEWNG